jgi:pimeloyl-ACP methyl ester carboxylesterase
MDLNTWVNNMALLVAGYKVYALDLWGFGYSTREPLDYGFELFVEQVHLLMETLGIEKATLFGHSMGGGTAIAYTVRYPERVHKLVLVDPVGLPFKMARRSKLFTLPWLPEFMLGLNNDYLRRKNLSEIWLHNPELLTDELYSLWSGFQKVQGTTPVLLEILRKKFFQELESEVDQLAEMDLPILLTWGRQDVAVPLHVGQEMHRRFKDSIFKIFEDCGHIPNFECAEEFNQLVTGFLSPAGEAATGAAEVG